MPDDRTETNEQQSVALSASPEFSEFLDTTPDPNTRMVYGRAVRQFLEWCQSKKIAPDHIETIVAYVKKIDEQYATLSTEPTLREHLEAIQLLLGYIGRTVPRGCCGPNCRCRCCRAMRSPNLAARSNAPADGVSL
jgi:hypothetical protein